MRAGVAFAVGEAAFGVAALAAVGEFNSLASTNTSTLGAGKTPVDITALNSRISTWVLVNRITFAGWAALTAAGIVHAQVTFVPERTYNDRPVPPRPKLVPIASPLPGGAMVGLGGTF